MLRSAILLWLAWLPAWSGGAGLTVVTLNLAKEPSAARVAGELRSIPALRDADLFLLQEVAHGTAAPLAAALGLIAAERADLAILSRRPLRDVRLRALGRYDLVFHSRVRYALSAAVERPGGAIRVVDLHLDTRLNLEDRLAELDAALPPRGGDAIVGGDFNSNPFYWIGHVLPLPSIPSQASRVESHMRALGYRSAIPLADATFDYLGMHLDWIWTRGFGAAVSRVYPLHFSDHHACWARLE